MFWVEINTNTHLRCGLCKITYEIKNCYLTAKRCKICHKKWRKEHYQINKEHTKAKTKEYDKLNPQCLIDRVKAYCKKYPEKIKFRQKEWNKKNPEKINAYSMKRHSAKINRTPDWLTKEQYREIEAYYKLAKELQWLSEEPLQVDHIVPLRGKNVSGLHVPWNLQILPRSENMKKKNIY